MSVHWKLNMPFLYLLFRKESIYNTIYFGFVWKAPFNSLDRLETPIFHTNEILRSANRLIENGILINTKSDTFWCVSNISKPFNLKTIVGALNARQQFQFSRAKYQRISLVSCVWRQRLCNTVSSTIDLCIGCRDIALETSNTQYVFGALSVSKFVYRFIPTSYFFLVLTHQAVSYFE